MRWGVDTQVHNAHRCHFFALVWFGSLEVRGVLKFMPFGPESPFYFKEIIRDVAKNSCIRGNIRGTPFKYDSSKKMESHSGGDIRYQITFFKSS